MLTCKCRQLVRCGQRLLAPANTQIIEKIANATHPLLNSGDYRQMHIEMGFDGAPGSDAESFRKVLADAVTFWEPVIKRFGLKIDSS